MIYINMKKRGYELLETYPKYLELQRDRLNKTWQDLMREGKIDVVNLRVSSLSRLVEEAVGEALDIYDKSPNKPPIRYRLLHWKRMRESGNIDRLEDKKGAILFYYSKPIAPHVTLNGLEDYENANGNLVSISSLADTLLYFKFALFSLFSGKPLIIADESRYVFSPWNQKSRRYPLPYLEISDSGVIDLLGKYNVPVKQRMVPEVRYCEETSMIWLKLDDVDLNKIYGMVQSRTVEILDGEKDERYDRLLLRVERFIDQHHSDLRTVVTSYLLASQELFLGRYRTIPTDLLHITITGKKDGKYELRTPGNINPNYGVTFINKDELIVVPMHSLLEYVKNSQERITLVIIRSEGQSNVIITYYFTTPKASEEAYRNESIKYIKSVL